MKLLVLGGTRFLGRAIVADALSRGWDVTAVHRGVTGAQDPAVDAVVADRSSAQQLADGLGQGSWDLVVDTWAGAPAVAAIVTAPLTLLPAAGCVIDTVGGVVSGAPPLGTNTMSRKYAVGSANAGKLPAGCP